MKYYAYFSEFFNVYCLRSAKNEIEESALLSIGYERIPREKARKLAKREKDARASGAAFAGYADSKIIPASCDPAIISRLQLRGNKQ